MALVQKRPTPSDNQDLEEPPQPKRQKLNGTKAQPKPKPKKKKPTNEEEDEEGDDFVSSDKDESDESGGEKGELEAELEDLACTAS